MANIRNFLFDKEFDNFFKKNNKCIDMDNFFSFIEKTNLTSITHEGNKLITFIDEKGLATIKSLNNNKIYKIGLDYTSGNEEDRIQQRLNATRNFQKYCDLLKEKKYIKSAPLLNVLKQHFEDFDNILNKNNKDAFNQYHEELALQDLNGTLKEVKKKNNLELKKRKIS